MLMKQHTDHQHQTFHILSKFTNVHERSRLVNEIGAKQKTKFGVLTKHLVALVLTK
jgi:hypothetical protein